MFHRKLMSAPLFKRGQASIQNLKSDKPPVQNVEEAKQQLQKGGVIQSQKEKKNKFQKN